MKPLSSNSLMKLISTKSSGLAAFALGSVSASGSKIFLIPLQGRILFRGKSIVSTDVIIGPFQDLLVLQSVVFCQHFYRCLPVRLDAVDGLDLRSDIPPDAVRTFPNECAGRGRPCALIGQSHAHEIIKTPFLRHEVVGLGEHSGLNLSRLQGTQTFWQTADLQECDILHRSQSEPL